jgi:hypothetical protein
MNNELPPLNAIGAPLSTPPSALRQAVSPLADTATTTPVGDGAAMARRRRRARARRAFAAAAVERTFV